MKTASGLSSESDPSNCKLFISNNLATFSKDMFSFVSNASKVTLIHLLDRLKVGGFKILDTQFINNHLKQFGAIEMSNKEFKNIISKNINKQADFYFYSKKGFLPNHLYPLKKNII